MTRKCLKKEQKSRFMIKSPCRARQRPPCRAPPEWLADWTPSLWVGHKLWKKNENHICLIFPHPDHCHITNIVIFIKTTRRLKLTLCLAFSPLYLLITNANHSSKEIAPSPFSSIFCNHVILISFVRKCFRVLCREI